MNRDGKNEDAAGAVRRDGFELEPELAQTLSDFRESVQLWSQQELVRPRSLATVRRSLWRLAAGWALGAVVAVSALTGGVYQARQHRMEAQQAAAEQALQEHALDEDDFLAAVDSDLSRQTPRALEPLAQLMSEESSR